MDRKETFITKRVSYVIVTYNGISPAHTADWLLRIAELYKEFKKALSGLKSLEN